MCVYGGLRQIHLTQGQGAEGRRTGFGSFGAAIFEPHNLGKGEVVRELAGPNRAFPLNRRNG